MRYSITTLLIIMLCVGALLAWATYERKPEVGEFLYFERDVRNVFVHPIKDASFNIYKEGDKHFLTLECNALPPKGGDRFSDNSSPHLSVSVMFDVDPKPKIAAGQRYEIKAYDYETYYHVTTFRYTSVWGNLHDGVVSINAINSETIDATIVGNDYDSDQGRIALRAHFKHSPSVSGNFY